MNGESLHVAGRLLGHRRASTTNRYVHLDDATLGQAAERVAAAIARKLCAAGGADAQPAGGGWGCGAPPIHIIWFVMHTINS